MPENTPSSVSFDPLSLKLAIKQSQFKSQAQFAQFLCVTPVTVSRWATGAITPDEATIRIMEKALGVSLRLRSPEEKEDTVPNDRPAYQDRMLQFMGAHALEHGDSFETRKRDYHPLAIINFPCFSLRRVTQEIEKQFGGFPVPSNSRVAPELRKSHRIYPIAVPYDREINYNSCYLLTTDAGRNSDSFADEYHLIHPIWSVPLSIAETQKRYLASISDPLSDKMSSISFIEIHNDHTIICFPGESDRIGTPRRLTREEAKNCTLIGEVILHQQVGPGYSGQEPITEQQ